jgi:hypothetical protein
MVDSDWKDRFWWRVYETLIDASALRFCRRCSIPFLAQKKRIYFHPTHAITDAGRNRAYWAKAREKVNLARRLAYDAKIKATLGAGVAARALRTPVTAVVSTTAGTSPTTAPPASEMKKKTAR